MNRVRFSSTGKTKLTLLRRALPENDRGKIVPATPDEVVIEANIQPGLVGNGTRYLAEAASVRRAVTVWSTSPIQQKLEIGSKRQTADQFQWKDEWYEVVRVIQYSMGRLDHYEATALGIDPFPVET